MSTDVPKPPKPPKTDNPLDPDNFHVTSEPGQLPEGLLGDVSGGTVKPDNFHVTDERP
ncbi:MULTISPECIES: hypothetical protein [unclassified Streptomyces]|uniref:hypothetical protein n=1 Tax=unclassified Streptomyces TaxID=2593676 RepID=UPI002E2AD401|nr:hypothetical protein [Streptomyces sp. NBC_00223]